jgi:hypothetical protein
MGFGLGGFMVITQEVKYAVHKEKIQQLEKFPAMLPGLALGGLQGDDHIA